MWGSVQSWVYFSTASSAKNIVIKTLTQNMHKIALHTLEMVNKNDFTANMSTQKKSTKASLCRLTC